MRVHHLNAATLCPMSSRLVNGTGPWFGRGRLVCHVLAIETKRGVVLVDTGLGTGDLATPLRLGKTWLRQVHPKLDGGEPAVAQLAGLGLSAQDVRHVVPTHLDLDHAGGISDFPEAQVHVHVREHDAAIHRVGTRADVRYVADQVRHARWALFDDGGERWFGFEGVRALDESDPDVLLVPLRGHTAGQTGVAVRTNRGWLLHAGDAYFHRGQIQTPPKAPLLIELFQRRSDVDRAARIANQELLRRLVAEHSAEVTVFSAHDPIELERLQPSERRQERDVHPLPARDHLQPGNG